MMQPLRVGVIGAGAIAEDNHIPALISFPDVTVSWVSDLDEKRASRVAWMYHTTACPAADVEKRLCETDVCLVAIPYGARKVILEQCAAANVAVYVEKPFARTVAEHREWLNRFPAEKIAVGYQRRFHRAVQIVRYLIQSGTFGRPLRVVGSMGAYSLKSGGARYHFDAKLAGGGVLMELGVHLLDLISYILNPTHVTIGEVRAMSDGPLDHHIEATCQFMPMACSAFVTVTRFKNVPNEIRIECESGKLRLTTDPTSAVYFSPGPETWMEIRPHLGPDQFATAPISSSGSFRAIWASFFEGIRQSRVTNASAATSLVTTQWVEGIYGAIADA